MKKNQRKIRKAKMRKEDGKEGEKGKGLKDRKKLNGVSSIQIT
jgi:hypothetical protein